MRRDESYSRWTDLRCCVVICCGVVHKPHYDDNVSEEETSEILFEVTDDFGRDLL